MERIFPFEHLDINGVKFPGFTLKHSNYDNADWGWLLTTIQNHISFW
jgi:hypothetical protein